MTVYVVACEYNHGSDCDGAIAIHGVYADPVKARRAKWAIMREHIGWGKDVFGRRNDAEWDVDVTVEEHEVQS